MQACNLLSFYLECVLRVVQAVHSDVILHGRAGDGAEDGELEALGGGGAQRLAHQAVRAQRLRQNVAGLVVHLNVARRGEVLLAHHHHVLRMRTGKTCDAACSWEKWDHRDAKPRHDNISVTLGRQVFSSINNRGKKDKLSYFCASNFTFSIFTPLNGDFSVKRAANCIFLSILHSSMAWRVELYLLSYCLKVVWIISSYIFVCKVYA